MISPLDLSVSNASNLTQFNKTLLRFFNLSDTPSSLFYAQIVSVLLVIFIAFIGFYVARLVLNLFHKFVVKKSKSQFDDVLFNVSVLKRLSHLVPPFILISLLPHILSPSGFTHAVVMNTTHIYFVVAVILLMIALNTALFSMLNHTKRFRNRPLHGLQQGVTVVFIAIGALIVFSILLSTPAKTILTTIGASAAVLMLVFRDSLLGVAAGIQLAANDMVKVGDWITVPNTQVDGEILEVNLTTVKVKNFDNTIVTIPPYMLVSKSFQNWKGMQETGHRRIARTINIDMRTVRFLNAEEIEELKKIALIKTYLEQTEDRVRTFNQTTQADKSVPLNGLNQTNLGVFRAYITEYLKHETRINESMLLMVRQLQPTETGIPLQLYCFARTTNWPVYETTMSDIFDHVLASTSFFDLRLFQNPTGWDLQQMTNKL